MLCQATFEVVKNAITKEPVLALPDIVKPFEVYVDASDIAISGVFMQEGYPIIYKSHKLSDIEKWWLTHK